MTPLVSVILPTYNCAAKLEPTLASVLAQERALCECLVMDGGSTDGTLDVLEQHGDQVRWVSEKDRGIYDAMNQGIGLARGEYLYFLGAGDSLRPGVLAALAPLLPRQPLTLVYGDVYQVQTGQIYAGAFDRSRLRTQNICHQAMFYERGIFALWGGFDLRYPLLADWVFNMRCFGEPRIHTRYVPLVIADYEGGGASMERVDVNFERDHAALIRRYLGLLQATAFKANLGKARLRRAGGRVRRAVLARLASRLASRQKRP